MGEARRRLEAVGGELDQQAERILEIDRIDEAAILDAAVLDAALVEPGDRLQEGDARHRNAMWWTQPGSVGVRRAPACGSHR